MLLIHRQLTFCSTITLAMTVGLISVSTAAQPRGGTVKSLSQISQGQQPTQSLIRASFSTKTDSLGFRWDPQTNGYFQSGNNSAFSGACTLAINGSTFSSTSSRRFMTQDQLHYQIGGTRSGMQVTRRITFDLKNAVVRYVEQIYNPTQSPAQISVMLRTSLGRGPATTVLTDKGATNPKSLGSSETGVMAFSPSNSGKTTVLWSLAGRGAKVRPVITSTQNQQFAFTYQITIPGGKTVSILHGIAQRNMTSLPNRSQLSTYFRPFRSSNFTKSIPKDVKTTIVNTSGLSVGWEPGDLGGLESLDITPGVTDTLAIGESTRLQGTAACEKLTIETRHGTVSLPLEKVAAIVGEKLTRSVQRVYLRDGQIFTGRVEIENLTFTMNTGVKLDVQPEHLDRLVLREQISDGNPEPETFGILVTREGDRLAIGSVADLSISAKTPWGERTIPLDEIEVLHPIDEPVGHRLELRDGTRVFAFLNGQPLKLKTLAFGEKAFDPTAMQSLSAVHRRSSEYEQTEPTVPHMVLVGENILMGSVEAESVHFVTDGQSIPIPPGQIRVLRRIDSRGPGNSQPQLLFSAELWDSGTVTGVMREPVLTVRTGGQLVKIPVRDIQEAHVPVPTVPAATRARIADLIRDLGHPDFKTREKASTAIAELGYLAKQQLRDTVDATSDPEVRRRALALLEELD